MWAALEPPSVFLGGKKMKDLVETFCRRFEQKDSQAFADLFSPDAIYIDSLYGTYEGREAIRAFHARCHKEAEAYHFQPATIVSDNGGNLSFEWTFSYVSLMPLSRGKRMALKGASFMTLRKGVIISYREYSDSVILLLGGNVPAEKIVKFYRRKYPDLFT